MIRVNLNSHTYPIYIDTPFLKLQELLAPYHNVFIITDKNVAHHHLSEFRAMLNKPSETIILEPGEKIKRLNVYESTVSSLLLKGIKRSDVLIAFGGGVIGDFTGFVAATLFRGMDYIAIPTTLLACVDSSIGGKVALNLDLGKNLIGAFHHPISVFIHTPYLNTLPRREFYSGMAELLKHGFINDASLFKDLEQNKPIHHLIEKSLLVKKSYVEQDEFDKSVRMILNFGHTFGHAIESHENYHGKLHGECVAIGMVLAASIGEFLGFTEKGTAARVEAVLKRYDLPTEFHDLSVLMPYIERDKKILNGELNLVVLTKIGEAKLVKVPVDVLRAWKGNEHAR